MIKMVVVFKNSKGWEFELNDFFSDKQVGDFTRCSLCLVTPKAPTRYFLADSLDMLPLFLGGKLYVREILGAPVFRYLASIPQTDFGTVQTLQDRLEQIIVMTETLAATLTGNHRWLCFTIQKLVQDALAMVFNFKNSKGWEFKPPPDLESEPTKHQRILDV